jgi:DNA-binding transcriptional LysR family regulator
LIAFSRFTRYFAEVARLGSLRRASEQLNVSASAIDRQILKAEEQFGLPLFERLPSGLRPTAAGELLLASTRRWAADYRRLEAQMRDLVGLRRGHVRIAVIDALARGFLAAEIRRMREEFSGVSFEIKVLDNIEVHSTIVAGEVDFGLLLNPQSSTDVVVRAYRDVVLGFVTPPDHPLARRAECRFSACVGFPMIVPAEPLAVSDQVRALQAATGVELSAAAASDSIQMMKSLVRAGVGVGVLSSIDVMDEAAAGELAFVPISDSMLKPLTLALCVARARQLSAAASLFLARVEEVLTTPPERGLGPESNASEFFTG